MTKKYGVKVGDICLMALILIVAVGMYLVPFLSGDGAQQAELVNAATGEIRLVSLKTDGDYTVTAQDVTLTVRVSGGAIRVEHADCRDQICVNTPAVSRAGQSIVCAPAGVIVRVVGEEAEVDGVSG